MIFQGKNVFNASFDDYAGDYDMVRPGYPTQLFKDIKDNCEVGTNSRLLEIGAGSGIATIELAKFGGHVIGIEPGANLAKIAKKQTKALDNVEIVETMLENFRTEKKFDMILAFTAFHWIDGNVKYQKVEEMLEDNGHLVLIWNSFFQSDSPATTEVNEAYREFLPETYEKSLQTSEVNQGVLSKLNGRELEIYRSDLFYPVFQKKYLVLYKYDEYTYPKLLNTFPKIVAVEEKKREKFLSRISEIVKQHKTITLPVLTTMITCEKRSSFLDKVLRS